MKLLAAPSPALSPVPRPRAARKAPADYLDPRDPYFFPFKLIAEKSSAPPQEASELRLECFESQENGGSND